MEVLEATGGRSPAEIVDAITAAVAAWMHVQLDDVSLLVFRHRA
jgi:hypothetical protein